MTHGTPEPTGPVVQEDREMTTEVQAEAFLVELLNEIMNVR